MWAMAFSPVPCDVEEGISPVFQDSDDEEERPQLWPQVHFAFLPACKSLAICQ